MNVRAVIFALLIASTLGCANQRVFKPSPAFEPPAGTKVRAVAGPSGQIEVWTTRMPACGDKPPLAYVIEVPGRGGVEKRSVESAVGRWKEWPVEVWTVNYPGYGRSEGEARMSAVSESLLAVYDAMQREFGDRPSFLFGESLGTAGAVYVSTKRPTAGVILLNPLPLRRLIVAKWGWMSLYIGAPLNAVQVPADLNLTSTAPYATAPACILIADKDIDIPKWLHDVVPNAYAGPKVVIHMPDEDHNSGVSPEASSLLQKWIEIRWNATFAATAR